MSANAKNLAQKLLYACLALFSGLAFGQDYGEVKGYKYAEYYAAPRETQMKSLLEGARAQLQPDGQTYLITGTKLQTFATNGGHEMVIETPRCVYNSVRRSVSSSGPLLARTADGKFSIEGEGFLWLQTNSSLFISNRVHTIVHPDLLAAPVAAGRTNTLAAEGRGFDIFSDQFDYHTNSGLATYRGNVDVSGTNLVLKAGVLEVKLPMEDRQLQTITAEQDVTVDYDLPAPESRIHATGQRAVYRVDTGLVRVTGQPAWQTGQRQGSGDELVIDRTNKVFRALGEGYIRLPGQGLGMASLLPSAGSPGPATAPATNQFVEIHSDNYEVRTNAAFFRRQVRFSEMADGQLKGEMDCGRADLTFANTNQLQRMVAEDNVVIRQQDQADRQMTAGRAVYTGANGQMELTENPKWRDGSREGTGDRIIVDAQRKEMDVRGNASMRMPAADLAQSSPAADASRKPARPATATNEFAEISSAEYIFMATNALFRGGVHVTHPQMNLACETLTVDLPPAGERIHRILAEQAVDFNMVDAQGKKVHGLGDNVLYTYDGKMGVTNDFVRLAGRPALLQTTNATLTNTVITFDRARNRLIASGKYAFHGLAPAADTNKLRMPKNKFFK
jgi:lipopolysaccharide export system protein LptA